MKIFSIFFIVLISVIVFADSRHFIFIYKENISHRWIDLCSEIFESEFQSLSNLFQHQPQKIKKVIITNNAWEFTEQTQMPYHIAAIYNKHFYIQNPKLLYQRRVLKGVIRHEMVHYFIEDISQKAKFPLWFNEGIAVYLAHQKPGQIEGLTFTSFKELNNDFKQKKNKSLKAYIISNLVIHYLIKKYKWEKINLLIKKTKESTSFQQAFQSVYNFSLSDFENTLKKNQFFR